MASKNLGIAGIIFILVFINNILNAEQVVLVKDYEHSLVISLLKSKDWKVRKRAAVTLGENAVTGAANDLIKLTKDEYSEVRKEAAIALGKLAHISAMKPMVYRFDENGNRRKEYGGLMFIKKEPIIKALSEMLKDNADEVRSKVMEALAETYKESAIEYVIAGLNDKSVLVRKSALKGLALSGGPSAIDAVKNLLKDPELKETAENTLRQIKINIDRRERIERDLRPR